jgi:hypothetical protein
MTTNSLPPASLRPRGEEGVGVGDAEKLGGDTNLRAGEVTVLRSFRHSCAGRARIRNRG